MRIIYVSNDGKQFDNKESAIAHEKRTEKIMGAMKEIKAYCKSTSCNNCALSDYCGDCFGYTPNEWETICDNKENCQECEKTSAENEEAINAMKTIQKYCENKDCESCIFGACSGSICLLNCGTVPEYWELNE